MKGISPLIASVLLIAFTIAIAGILATWATTFSRERLAIAAEEGECVGTLDVSSLVFTPGAATDTEKGIITFKVRNVGTSNLTGLRGTVEYSTPSKNRDYTASQMAMTDPLMPVRTQFARIVTGDQQKPLSIEVFSETCPRSPAKLFFR